MEIELTPPSRVAVLSLHVTPVHAMPSVCMYGCCHEVNGEHGLRPVQRNSVARAGSAASAKSPRMDAIGRPSPMLVPR